MDIRNIKSIDDLIIYFTEELNWNIDLDDFDEIDDITYDFDAADIGLKEEAFAKISSLRQLQPLCDEQKWGIFCVEFDSNKFEVSALRKILSGLIPKRRNAADHAVWAQKDLLFLCFWGTDNNRTIGIAHFEDKDAGLPQIKMIHVSPAIEDFSVIHTFEENIRKLSWVKDEADTEAWYQQWSSAFVTGYREVIHTSASLTIELAAAARYIHDQILDIYEVESESGYVHKLYKDFKDNLIHDMTEQQFADMYAQTVVYGIFSARCMDKTQGDFDVQEAIKCIPNTNPFLKRLMEECLGEGSERHLTFDELEVANVVEILTHTNTDLILKDFNRQTGGGREDPVIHFYEEFLTAYDKAQKVQRGVYYTPQPVVNFIVRAVDSILKTEFGLADGLASEETKTVKYMREKIRGQGMTEDTKEVPKVQILDPATGTGTFLRQTILQIYDNFKTKHKGESEEQIRKAWNEYVPKHLLPRLNGFELMMAPYAVAHMKLAMVLKDTGYDFGSDHRLNVFLTNSLEEPNGMVEVFDDGSVMTSLFDDPLAFESAEANQAKKNNGINVIIGNPPYSGISSNNNEFIANLINDYKYIDGVYFNERKHWLNDDYVKFIRLCEKIISEHGDGILAFINNHAFLDNPTFRCMRHHLLETFDIIYIVDLHGNVMRKEIAPNGERDENVFDIMQGVSINIFVKKTNTKKKCTAVFHNDMYGTRNTKYNNLNNSSVSYTQIEPVEPYFFFVPKDSSNSDTYSSGFSLSELFLQSVTGIVSMGDNFAYDQNEEVLYERLVKLQNREYNHNALNEEFSLGKNYADFIMSNAPLLELNEELLCKIAYRPFDEKYTYFDNKVLWRPRTEVMKHMLNDNIALIIPRQAITDNWSHVSVSTCLVDNRFHYSNKGIPIVCPLYLYDTEFGKEIKRPNLKSDIVHIIEEKLGIQLAEKRCDRSVFTPVDLLDYIYAVLHSPKYREKYKEFLKIDFPRVPYPTDQETFWKMVEIGGKLRECHLMQTEFDTAAYSFIGDGTNEVVKPEYKNGRVYISKTQYFDNVPQAQWEQYIGGYQPLQKWLKDRKKTMLSAEDIEHYKKIIAALKLTEELMTEIDQVVEF